MKDFAELLKAFASLLWPIGVFGGVYFFRNELRDILLRIIKVKISGAELEIHEKISTLNKQVEKENTTTIVSKEVTRLTGSQQEPDIIPIIKETVNSPKAALLLISAEIEREARDLVASLGLLKGQEPVSFIKILELISDRGGIQKGIIKLAKSFWNIRNQIIHGRLSTEISDAEFIRMIDIGKKILDNLKSIPHEINTIYHPGVTIYADAECKTIRNGILGVILESVHSRDKTRSHRIFPTTKTNYRQGSRVSWEWNMKLVTGESWYKDPDTNTITYAWSEAAEFTGRNIDEI